MGKRELLIALAFLVAGTIVFQFSAPPAKPASTGFSFSKLIDSARREIKGNQSYPAPKRTMTYAVTPDITELRLTGLSGSGVAKIVGDARTDVSMDLFVTSTGEDQTAATAIANKTIVKEDRVGGTLTLTVVFPTEETQTGRVEIQIPERLAVKLDGLRETTISHVRAVDFVNPTRGTTLIDHVAGRVSGEQSAGAITLASIGALKMTLTRTRGRISDVAGESSLDVRDGDTEIITSRGPLTIEQRRGNITIRGHKGPVNVSGTEGRVRVEGTLDEVRCDLRRTEVDAELARNVASSLVTSDEELRVSWADAANVRLDAVATNGKIDATAWSLTPGGTSTEARLDAALGTANAAAPRVSLRNQNANIVVQKSRKK